MGVGTTSQQKHSHLNLSRSFALLLDPAHLQALLLSSHMERFGPTWPQLSIFIQVPEVVKQGRGWDLS